MTELVTAGVREAAERLRQAGTLRRPCAPVRDIIGDDNLDLAYAVQRRVVAMSMTSGARPVGRKIGLTSEAVQRQLGVRQPDYGVLLDDMQVEDGGTVSTSRLIQPRIEAEVAVRLGADLSGDPSIDEVRAAVDGVTAALEIVDSRIAAWDITIADTIADNASSGMFVFGSHWYPLGDLDLRPLAMQLSLGQDVVSTGSGVACLGDPIIAIQWLARAVASYGDPLRAGEVVLSGALGPMVDVVEGSTVRAAIDRLGTVSVTFAAQRETVPRRPDIDLDGVLLAAEQGPGDHD